MADPVQPPEGSLAVLRLAAATAARQLYEVRLGAGAPGALLLLSRAAASPPGWADRLRALVALGQGIDPGAARGFALFDAVGAVAGVPALLRPWVEGIGSGAFARTKVDGLPPLLVLLALVDVASALVALHAQGLAHGRVAAESLILCPDGRLVLVDVGLEPALSGEPGSEAADLRQLGLLAYRWLSGRALELPQGEGPPLDLQLPSRLDRRVPAQADPLVLRALNAGGPRGLRQARELVVGLRGVLRSAGAAVSAADIAGWAEKHARAGAGPGRSIRPTLRVGESVLWEPLAPEAARVSRRPARPQVDDPGPAAPSQPKAQPEAETSSSYPSQTARTQVDRPAREAEAAWVLRAGAGATGTASAPGEPSLGSVSRVEDLRAARRRRLVLGLGTAVLALGVAFLGVVSLRHPSREVPPSDEALAPASAPAPGAAARDIAKAVAPPLPAFEPSPLPAYRPDGPAKPRPTASPSRSSKGDGRAERRVRGSGRGAGRGAFLSLQSDRVARVFVDGRDIHRLTPLQRYPISPGRHVVRLVAAMGGGGSAEFKIDAQRGREVFRFGSVDE